MLMKCLANLMFMCVLNSLNLFATVIFQITLQTWVLCNGGVFQLGRKTFREHSRAFEDVDFESNRLDVVMGEAFKSPVSIITGFLICVVILYSTAMSLYLVIPHIFYSNQAY